LDLACESAVHTFGRVVNRFLHYVK